MFTTILLGALCLSSQINGDDSESFSLSVADFTVDLLKTLAKSPSENLLFSPSSIDLLLSQLQQGSAGKTEQEFNTALHRDKTLSRQGYSQLLKSVANDIKGVTMKIATKTYVKSDVPLNDDFKNIATDDFGAGIEALDLAAPEAVDTINKWVASATEDHIKDLINAGSLTTDSVMVLLSAAYFKGKWKEQFRKGRSATARFFIGPNASVEVPYMLQSRRMISGVNHELGLKWVHLPYQGDQYSMLLVLPIADYELDSVIKNLSGSDLKALLSSQDKKYVRLRMPRFTLKLKTMLQGPLQKMGLTSMFTEEAEFPGISPQAGIKVSKALHDAFLEVNEEGSEATAATALVVNTLSLTSYHDEFQFTVNQPFLAIICDKSRNVPHFVARVVNPS